MTFKELLKKADLSCAQLARRVGVSRAIAHAWTSGVSAPTYDKLPLIAQHLGVDTITVFNALLETKNKKGK